MKFNSILCVTGILILSLNVNADVIVIDPENDGLTTFDWTALCSDCNSYQGDDTFNYFNKVTGNLILDGYTEGEEFTFDLSNIVSFQYDGPSNHVDKFVLHNALYSESDVWTNSSDFYDTYTAVYGNSGFTFNDEVVNDDGYSEFAENITGSGWLAADLSSYSLDISFDTYVAIDEFGKYIRPSTLANGETMTIKKETFNIYYNINTDWGVKLGGDLYDLGNGAQISLPNNTPVTDVPEPSTLFLFGISVLGLLRLRTKKS